MARKNAAFAALAGAAALVALTACGSSDVTGGGSKSVGKPGSPKAPAASASASASAEPSGKDNGVAALTGKEISDKAQAALLHAPSVHVAGGMADGANTIRIDMRITSSGDCRGNYDLGPTQGKVEIIKIGEKVWMKPDETFWKTQTGSDKEGAAAAELLKGRYLAGTTADKGMKDSTAFCDLAALASDDNDSSSTYTKGGRSTVGTVPVIEVTAKESSDTSVISVATTGEPYPMKIVAQGKDGGELNFDEYGKPVSTEEPPADQTIDIKKFERDTGAQA